MVGGILLIAISLVGLTNGQQCTDSSGTAVTCPLVCQFQNNGTFFTSARQCSNTLSDRDCDSLFPCTGTCTPNNGLTAVDTSSPNNNPNVRAYACTSPTLREYALQCAKSCSMCCETSSYNCDDDSSSPISCQANVNKCKDSSWVNIMSQYCPRTCGLCTNGTCTDVISGCNTMTSLCRNVDWVDYMRTNCARTCDVCTNTPAIACSDIASNCAVNSNLCSNSVYYVSVPIGMPKAINNV